MPKIPRTLLAFSKDLRLRQTSWELTLWEHLRAKKFGIKFKRQVVVGPYIVDFCAKRAKVIVELDGYYHKGKDHKRIDYFKQAGYKVLGFWDSEVENDLSEVLTKIEAAIIG